MKKLKIQFWKAEKALAMQVLEQEGLPERETEGFIRISDCLCMLIEELLLRGCSIKEDFVVDVIDFSSNTERDAYLHWAVNAITDELFTEGELKIGEMCEVRNSRSDNWGKRKLVAILPAQYDERFIAEWEDYPTQHSSWKMRPPNSETHRAQNRGVRTTCHLYLGGEMKDENGIEIDCENCVLYAGRYCDVRETFSGCKDDFRPTEKAYKARIKELQDELYADKYNYESWEEIKEEHQKLEATISDLKRENALLKDGESHITDVKLSPKFIKSIIRAVNSEVEILKRELRFTDEEIDFIKKAISMAILDCETNPPKPSDENLILMWSIKSKCDGLLKERKDK